MREPTPTDHLVQFTYLCLVLAIVILGGAAILNQAWS